MTTEEEHERAVRTRAGRGLVLSIFALGILMGQFVTKLSFGAMVGVVMGILIPSFAAWVWGERTRPKMSAAWLLGGPLIFVGATFSGVIGLGGGTASLVMPVALLAAIFVMHDLSVGPTLMIMGGVLATLVRFDEQFVWTNVPEANAWFIGLGVLLTVIAALIERDRLSRLQGAPTPLVWAGVRIGFLVLWTLLVLAARQSLKPNGLFEAIGLQARGDAGQLTMLSVVVVMVVIATFMFRGRKRKDETPVAEPGAPRNV